MSKLPPGTEELMERPGAIRDKNEARFEKLEIVSDLSVEPTLTAVEIQPGELITVPSPLLPAAMTVAIPTALKLSIAVFVAAA